jgi:hypothetical protein
LSTPAVIVGHLAPDLDCLAAIWILVRFGKAAEAELQFVPAGRTLGELPADGDPLVVHVDTGGGRFDHHQSADPSLSAAELVRRELAPGDEALRRLVEQVTRLDNAEAGPGQQPALFSINDLITGYNALYPSRPEQVAQAMLPNLDAWYEQERRQLRLERAFERRSEFQTRWGLGIAMQSDDGASSRLAYRHGAVLFAYRDRRGYMGVAAQRRSAVDLTPVYHDLKRIDPDADWYLHPGNRLLLCGTPKAPPRHLSTLSLDELVNVLKRR